MSVMSADNTLERLREVRLPLLHLHKTLLDYERETYERQNDRIENAYEVLRLVMHDPWFAWLHSISELVVSIDEMLDADEPPAAADIEAVIKQARQLIVPSETGTEFQQKYFAALQNSPDAVLAHADTVRVLGPLNAK
jgi:hypothetical protein